MQLSQTVKRFWQFIAGYSLAAISVSGIHALLFGWPVGLFAGGVVLLLFLIIMAVGQPLFVPYRVQQWQVEPVQITHDWPAHDFSELDRLTAALVERGFVPLQDYAQPQRAGKFQPIARCFGNAAIGAFAEIGFCLVNPQEEAAEADGDAPGTDAAAAQTALVAIPQPPITYTVFLSLFDRGWMLIDGNFAPHRRESLIYAWRNPREVRHYYPDLSPTVLADRHLDHRQMMSQQLNLQVSQLDNISWDGYRAIQQELITQPWRRLRRRNLLIAMVEATRFERQPVYEWLGEYRPVARQDIPLG